jgi:hypothetical protein
MTLKLDNLMTPIISPWIVYLIGLCDSISTAFIILSLLLALGWVVYAGMVAMYCDGPLYPTEESWKPFNALKSRIAKWLSIAAALFLTATFIPSSQTAATMLLADKMTPAMLENIKGQALELIKDVKTATD